MRGRIYGFHRVIAQADQLRSHPSTMSVPNYRTVVVLAVSHSTAAE